MKLNVVSKSLEDTFNIGADIGKKCLGGEVFLLNGELGAGKTSFLQGLASGLGVKSKVNSPTFNILKIYKTNGPSIKQFCHVDAYRLNSGKDLKDIGIDEFITNDTVLAIEWADKVKSMWPENGIFINITSIDENTRKIVIK